MTVYESIMHGKYLYTYEGKFLIPTAKDEPMSKGEIKRILIQKEIEFDVLEIVRVK